MHAGSTRPWGWVLLAAALFGCGGGDDEVTTSGDSAPGPLSYYGDVKPILDAKCVGCHQDGGIAPFSLEGHDTAGQLAASIKQAVVSRTMPPWMPDSSCAEYEGDRSLSDEQIQTIAAWADSGAVAGDPAAEGPPLDATVQTALPRVDVTLEMPVEYSPESEPDDYRCFVLDWPSDSTRYVTAFQVRPGEARVVHHVIAFQAKPAQLAELEALDAADPKLGYPCFGGPGLSQVNWVGSWVPGAGTRIYPEGTGIKIEPGSKMILQMHYNTLSAGNLPDRTAIDMTLESSVEKEGIYQPWTNPGWPRGGADMSIPAFESDVSHAFAFDATRLTGGKPFRIYMGALHMHTLGTRARLSVERADGSSECLLDIPRWNFHWQGAYSLVDPKVFNPGDILSLECHWDNSPANQPIIDGKQQVPRDVGWGENTTDEMCLGNFYMTEL